MATAKKTPSGKYRVRVYSNAEKRYVSITRPTKREAERAAQEYLLQAEMSADPVSMTFREAAEAYIQQRTPVLSPTTINSYKGYIKNNTGRFNDVPLNQITFQLVQDWVNALTVSRSPKTVHNCYGFFTAVINYHDVPLRLNKIKLPSKTRHFKRLPTADIVLDTFRGTDIELPVLLGVWCGLRFSEILGIRKQDIDGDILTINQVIVYVGGKPTVKKNAKTYNSNRQIRLPKPILQLIQAADTKPADTVITFTRKQIYDRFTKAMKKEGYSVTFHDLRHINASVMASLGIPDLYAMERGGWSNTSTLKAVYQQTFDDERNRIDTQIDNYFYDIYDLKYDLKNLKAR